MENASAGMERLLRQAVLYARMPLGVIAVAGLLLAGTVHVAAIRGVDVEAMWPSVWLLHGALFPIVMLAAVTSAAAGARTRAPGTRISLREFLALVPVTARLVIALALIYVIATLFFLGPLTGMGDPTVQDGRFFFNDHGIIREVTDSQFRLQRSLSLRLYSAVWVYLYLFAAVYVLCARRPANR